MSCLTEDRTCLPDGLWTSAAWLEAAAKKPRLWVRGVAVARLRARWHPDDVDAWTPAQWVLMLRRDANVLTNVRQWEKDLARMREIGMLESERVDVRFDRPHPNFVEETNQTGPLPGMPADAGMPRRRYASDAPERRAERRQRHGAIDSTNTPQRSTTDSASTPQRSAIDSTTTPPVHCTVTVQSSTDSGQEQLGDISPKPVLIPGRNSTEQSVGGLRMATPRTIVERLVEVGMEPEKAVARVAEFGEQRCAEAVDAIRYWPTPVRKKLGFVIDYLVKKRAAPPGLVAAWEQQAQQNMALLGSVPGGKADAPAVAPAPALEAVVRQRHPVELLPVHPEPEEEPDPQDLAEIEAWNREIQAMIDAA